MVSPGYKQALNSDGVDGDGGGDDDDDNDDNNKHLFWKYCAKFLKRVISFKLL